MNCYEREQFIAELIKDEILKIDGVECNILYWNRGISDKEIYRFAPNVLMTFPLTLLPLIKLVARIKLVCNPTVVSFVTEGYINFDCEKFIFGHYMFPSSLVDFWGVWGEKYGEYLWNDMSKKGMIKCRENIKVFGYPLWEHKHLQKIKIANSCEKEILQLIEKSKKVILVLSGFAEANKDRNDMINSIDAYDVTSKDKDSQIDLLLQREEKIREYREKYYSLVMEMIEENPDITFLLKLHPKEIECIKSGKGYDYTGFGKWNNVKVVSENNSIGMYIDKVNAVVHYGSTVAWEAYIYGIPTIKIILNDETLKFYSTAFTPGESFDCEEKREILNWIKESDEKIIHKREFDKYIKEYFNYDRTREYYPSRDLAQFLCKHCEPPQYCVEEYSQFADIDMEFRMCLLREGLRDIVAMRSTTGIHKIKLALKKYEY